MTERIELPPHVLSPHGPVGVSLSKFMKDESYIGEDEHLLSVELAMIAGEAVYVVDYATTDNPLGQHASE